jgi:hypothetical protein
MICKRIKHHHCPLKGIKISVVIIAVHKNGPMLWQTARRLGNLLEVQQNIDLDIETGGASRSGRWAQRPGSKEAAVEPDRRGSFLRR